MSAPLKNPASEQVQALARLKISFRGVGCVPPQICDMLADPYTFDDSEVLDFTTGNSAIARVLHANPASDEMLRLVYPDTNGSPLMDGLDRFLSRSLSGQALRDRLDVCSDWLAKHFVRRSVRIIDLGGGSGSYAFAALRLKDKESYQGLIWDDLDTDLEALNCARTRASDTGLNHVVRVRPGNFMSDSAILPDKADYAVLIGVLCGMSTDTSMSVLKRIKLHLKPRGEILAATLLQRAFDEDPRTFRILCNVGGWQLRPKTPGQVIEVFQSSGWEILSIMSERPTGDGQYAVVHARAL